MLGLSLALTPGNPVLSGPSTVSALEAQNFVRFTRADLDYLSKTISTTTLADSDEVTFAGWIKFKDNDGANQVVFRVDAGGATAILAVLRNATNNFTLSLSDTTPTTVLSATTSGTYTIASGLMHLLVTARRTGGAWDPHIYINGSAVGLQAIVTNTDTTCGLSAATRVRVGAGATPATTNALGAEVSDFVFSRTYTAAADVAKYYDAGWVNLGDDGTDSGLAVPVVYLGGESRANTDTGLTAGNGWQDGYNRGTLGAFTATGTIDNAPGKVRFTATDIDYLVADVSVTPLTGTPASVTSFLFVSRFRWIDDTESQALLHAVDLNSYIRMNFSIGRNGRLGISGRDDTSALEFSIGGSLTNPNGTALVDGEEYIVAVACNGSTGVLQSYLYAVATGTWAANSADVVTAPTANMALLPDSEWVIGANTQVGGYPLNSEVSYIGLAMAADTSCYVDISNAGVQTNILGAPSGWGVGTPIILFGQQTDGTPDHATTWNAGTNRGGGAGTWIMTGAVTDV